MVLIIVASTIITIFIALIFSFPRLLFLFLVIISSLLSFFLSRYCSGDNVDAQKLARFTLRFNFFFLFVILIVVRTYIEASGSQKLPNQRKYILYIYIIYTYIILSS